MSDLKEQTLIQSYIEQNAFYNEEHALEEFTSIKQALIAGIKFGLEMQANGLPNNHEQALHIQRVSNSLPDHCSFWNKECFTDYACENGAICEYDKRQ